MGKVAHTKLRFIRAKNPELLMGYVTALPYKVEIKSIVHDGQKWVLWFNLPDDLDIRREKLSGELD